jgi:hypothetical protein
VDVSYALRFLEAVFGALGPEDAVSDAVLNEAEARLGVRLPPALRTLYAVTGSSKSIHCAYNELLPPGRIYFADDHLVFYEENQVVVVWGIPQSRLGDDDPPVEQGQPNSMRRDMFYPEFRSVSEFACAQGAWQAVNGGLPYSGIRNRPRADAPRPASRPGLQAKLGPADLVTEDMSAWLVDGGVAIELPDGYLGLATQSAEQFSVSSERIGLALKDWDSATLRER